MSNITVVKDTYAYTLNGNETESRDYTNSGSFKWVNVWVYVIECNYKTSYHHMAFYFQPLCEMNKQHRQHRQQTLFSTIKTDEDQQNLLFLKYLLFLDYGGGTSHHYPNSYTYTYTQCTYGWMEECLFIVENWSKQIFTDLYRYCIVYTVHNSYLHVRRHRSIIIPACLDTCMHEFLIMQAKK